MLVLIKKMETLSDALQPNKELDADYKATKNVDQGFFQKPEVGKSFALMGISTYFISSQVVEIIEDVEISGVFKTLNSIYYWEIKSKSNESGSEDSPVLGKDRP